MNPELDDKLVYVACDYVATGEGHSVYLLITRAYPRKEDYVKESYIDEDGEFHFFPETQNTPDERAMREFKDEFGDYMAIGAEIIAREEFLHKYANYIPKVVYNVTDSSREGCPPPGFSWKMSLHMNFS